VIVEIDHLLTYVSSIDDAAETYRRLGFTLTPLSDISPMGIANRLITFRPRTPGSASFIELMAVTDPAKLPPPMRRLLSGDEGGKSMVLATTDAGSTHRMLAGLGHPFAPPVHVKREWKISDSTSVFPEFDVLLPTDRELPFNACQYRDAGVYVRDEWLTHANTAIYLDALSASISAGSTCENDFAAVLRSPRERLSDGCVAVTAGRTRIELETVAPQSAMPTKSRYTGVRVLVKSLADCGRHLERNHVPHCISDADIVVAPAACHGVQVQFRQMAKA
jgi:hypothetical protein